MFILFVYLLFAMPYNSVLRKLMTRYQVDALSAAELITQWAGTPIKKRKINSYISDPSNRRYQKCPREYVIALANALKQKGSISNEDHLAVTTYTEAELEQYFENHEHNNNFNRSG